MAQNIKKVLCVTANPCTDRLIWYKQSPEKPTRTYRQLGGKGINVSRMMAWLGCDVISLSFADPEGTDSMAELAKREPCRTVLVPVKQPVREIPTYINKEQHVARVGYVNTNRMTPPEAESFVLEYTRLLETEAPDMVIISGSACPGAADTYPAMVRLAKAAGLPVILDSYGECFLKALPEKPDFVKPNREELEKAVGPVPEGEEIQGARKLIKMGAGCVLLTTGEGRSYCVTADSAQTCETFSVPTVSAVGCGDSLVAFFAYGLLCGMSVERAFEIGRAAGAANAMQAFSGRVKKEQVCRVLRKAGLPEF